MKQNSVEVRGRILFYNGKEIGDVYRGWFHPNGRGLKLGLAGAQVSLRSALDYVTDHLLREKKLTHAEWRRIRVNYGRNR